MSAVTQLLDSQNEPVFHIIDFTNQQLNLDDIIKGSNEFARGNDPLFHHPMLREMVFVTHEKLIQLTAKGLQSETFGKVKSQSFETLDEAMAYVRGKI